MKVKLDALNEKKTKGKGGVRPGAGRPKGSTKEPTKQIRLPADIATFMKENPQCYEDIRKLMRMHAA